jgi:hypothetical protein
MEKLPDHPSIGAESQIRGSQGRWGGRIANTQSPITVDEIVAKESVLISTSDVKL